MNTTVETVTFKLAGGATRKDFLAANEAMIDWVLRQPGFQYRSLSEKDDGSWIDIIYWSTHDEALASGEAFKRDMMSKDFAMMIDPSSINMGHSAVASQLMAAQAA